MRSHSSLVQANSQFKLPFSCAMCATGEASSGLTAWEDPCCLLETVAGESVKSCPWYLSSLAGREHRPWIFLAFLRSYREPMRSGPRAVESMLPT